MVSGSRQLVWRYFIIEVKDELDMGIDVFDDIIDHSYDVIENPIDRIYQAITKNKELLTNNQYVKDLERYNEESQWGYKQ